MSENSTAKKENLFVRLMRRWFLDGMSYMALGLFCTLIIGTIIQQLGKIPYCSFINDIVSSGGKNMAMSNPIVGAAIGVAVAYGLKHKPLVIFSSAVTGALGCVATYGAGDAAVAAGPAGAFIAALVGAEIGGLYAGKTKVDIILVPLGVLLSGGAVAAFVSPVFGWLLQQLGVFINMACERNPIFYGVVISVIVGMVLTAPISSAALCAMLGLSGLAAGAATVGCCVNMVGFAVASFKDNGWSGVVSQGIGTSMLQVPNICRKPVIWLPVIITSAVLGPLATTLFQMKNFGISAGMGTSGLVGCIGTFTVMTEAGELWWIVLIKIAILHFLLPGLLVWALTLLFRKLGWIKDGDMKIRQ